MIYVLGGRGFVGSAIVRHLQSAGIEHRAISRDNFEAFRGTSCDVLINANGNSKKFLSDREPLTDFDLSVRSVADSLQAFRFGRYVLLSTGDVYPRQDLPAGTLEDSNIDPAAQSRYGLHKLLAELQVRNVARQWLIFRMGGFVGPGLKKNAVYDMLTDAPVWLSPMSELQFISTDAAARLMWKIVERGVSGEIINLGAQGVVNLGALHEAIGSRSSFNDGARFVRYELSLQKLELLAGEPLPKSTDEVLGFVTSVRAGQCALG